MFASLPVEHIPQDPLFWACAVASLVGFAAWYLYGGFIYENYTRIKWFRRLFLPWMTPFIENVDDSIDDVDLSRLYVETRVTEEEMALEAEVPSEDYDDVMESLGEFFLDNNFRPEVILSSLATNEENNEEVGNWVLTGPDKSHSGTRLHELVLMIASKWQLHIRIFYDVDNETLKFYPHHEYNPYNPLYAKKHFNGVEYDVDLGREMFEKRFLTTLDEGPLNNYEHDVNR